MDVNSTPDKNEARSGRITTNLDEAEKQFELQASSSHSAENLNQQAKHQHGDGAQQMNLLKKCQKEQRRIHSDTDLTKMRNFPESNGSAIQQQSSAVNEVHAVHSQQQGKSAEYQKQQVITQTILESESEDKDESSESSIYTRFSELTKKQWATIGMLAIASLCSTVAFSCIAPFFPKEAKLKGMNQSEIGLVFGIFELIMFVTAPILGKYMSFIGSKPMLITGLLLTGITITGFGMLNLLPSGRIFFWSSLFIRCAEALGDACFVTSSFAISAKCFPGRIATIVGIMETFVGLGFATGPFIGGVLYEYGGFKLPFFVLGFLIILATILSYILIEKIEDEPADDAMGMLSMLKIPVIWLMVFAIVICAISLSFFDPILANHLESFNLSATFVGLMFLIFDGFYCLTAPLWGLLLERWHCCNALMLFGSIATVFSLILIGPAPFLNIEKNLILIGISLAILGIASGALYIPTFQNCFDVVKENGYDDSFQTYGYVSGVFQSAFAFGAFIGPTLGSISVESVGLPITTTFIAGIIIVFIFALLAFLIYKQFFPAGASSNTKSTTKKNPPTSLEA